MKIGFIGTGSMGTTLVKAFLKSKKFQPSSIFIFNRTKHKADLLITDHPGLQLTDSNQDLVRNVDTFFICVKPGEYRSVLDEIKDDVKKEQLCISITSPVMIHELESWLEAKIVKMIPSITNLALQGTSLYIPGSRMTIEDEDKLVDFLSSISHPLKIEEKHTRISSDLASVAPAFVANILAQLIQTAHSRTGIPLETATPLVERMVEGVVGLIHEEGFSFEHLQKRVSVPGGITEVALSVLNKEISPIFHNVFQLTHDKFTEDVKKVSESLSQ